MAVLTMLLIVGIGQVWGADVTFTANQDKGSTTNTSADSMTKSGITISSTSAGLAYDEYRFYNGTITISSTVGNITKIEFTCTSSNYATVLGGSTASTGSLSASSNTVTWTGSSSSFTIKNTAQTRASKIVVTTASVTPPTPATITLSEAGVERSITGKNVGEQYELPSTSSQTCGTKTFVGWSYVTIDKSSTTPATNFYEPGASVTLAARQKFYAVFAESSGSSVITWSKTDIANIESTDEVVITMTKGNLTYAMSNNNGTSSAPTATTLTISNNAITNVIPEIYKWNITNNNGSLTIYPKGTTSTWLYCTNTNNGVRVGTNTNKTFTISGNYLQHTATSRYVGVYITTSPDWRCYTSTTGNSNIAGQTLAFYKKTTTSGYQNYTTECSTPTEFTVSFDVNGHGTAPDAQIVASGQKATAPTPAPTATGYTFGGWYKESECENEFDFKTPITEDITLYAKWTAIQTTITLNANGGSGNTTSVAATYDSSTLNPSSITNPTKTGHTFGGWYSGEGGTGSLVINSSGKLQANVSGFTGTNGVWKATTNKTLYAKWTPTVYAINYKDQGGANFSGQHEAGYPQNHTYNTATTLKSASKNHYTFDGWYKENDCSGIAVTTLGATEYTDNLTLYAKWTAKTYTITLDANGGTFVDKRDSQTKGSATFDYIYGTYATYNDAPNLTEYYSDLKRDGYQFDKWVSAGSPWNKLFTSTGDRTIQAQWSKLYTITLYENDTEIKLTPQTSTSYTLPNELSAGSCQDDTKELVGWSTVAIPTPGDMPTSKFYELGETVTLSEDKTTFYAVFATPKTIPGGTEEKEETTTLNFSAQGYGNGEEVTSLTIDDVTVAFNKGTNSNVPKYYNTGAAVRVYGGGYFTVTVPNESSISTIALTFGSGDESNTITTNSNTYSNGTWTGSAQSVKFTVGGTTGHRRIKSVKVTYTTTVQADDIVTYSKYSTTCEAVTDIELQSIKISGDLTKKTYTVGDDLDFGGLTVTAKYSNATSKNVTNEVEWSDVTLTVGQTSVTLTATYEGKTDDITITGLTVSSPATPEPEGEWVLTQLADITCSDLVVITMKNSNGTYALTNGNGTSDAPKATEVEIANDKLKTEPSEILQWVVMNNNGELTIYPVNDYNRWLYCFKHNNGVRVGDNQNNVFTIDDETGYLYHVSEERYLGVYNSSDWRCYETVNNNIKEQTLAFFVKKDANPNPCEKPVDDGINPVATFIFNTAEGLDDLGIDYPNTPAGSGAYKNDMSNDESYTQEGITFTNVQKGSTATRVWCSSAGNLDLRIYQNATVKFSVPDNMYIRKIIFNGDALSSISPNKGNLKSKIWSGREREVLFSVADGADVVKIYTISFALEYTRTVTDDNKWGTICLPYASASTTGATFYEVSSLVVGEGLWLDQLANGAQLVAGKPYIFYATDSEITVTYTGDAKAAPVAGENGLTGTFTDIAEGGVQGHYIIAQNKIWQANDKNTLPANRAYIANTVPTTPQAQIPGRRRVCMGENTTTDFENITNGENNTIKVIENGQLIIIRNGEKYNIQGQKL